MPNHYFRFKQFTVHQEHCAMKVCTDACLFGAWLAHSSGLAVHSLLDIGTGTGLLSLMYAQKNLSTVIDAVEIDEAAALQAKENFEASPWKERLNIHHCALQDFRPGPRYDLIICNPPFFENNLKSDDHKRNLALHSSALSFDELLAGVWKLLNEEGLFAVLLTPHRAEIFIQTALAGKLFIQQRIDVKQTPKHSYFRTMLLFGKHPTISSADEIIIMKDDRYTEKFSELLKDYYLKL